MDIRTQRLLERTFDFGVNIMKFLKKLPDDFIYRIPKRILQKLYDEDKYQQDFEIFIKESQEIKNIFAAIKKSSKEV